MAALCNRAGHYIFVLWFLLSFFFFFPRLISAAADWMSTILPHIVYHCANLECRSEMCCTRLAGNTGRKRSPFWHHRTKLSGYIFGTKACMDNRKQNLLNINISSICPDNMVNFGLLTAEICWRVWGTPANFNGFRVLAPLLHGTLVVGVSRTLLSWTEGATYIRQGGHHVGHWPTFLVFMFLTFYVENW